MRDDRFSGDSGNTLWTLSALEAAQDAGQLPPWAADAYSGFKATVLDPGFPCTFGIVAQEKGMLRYAFAPSARAEADRLHIRAAITEYLEHLKGLSRTDAAMALLVLFLHADGIAPSLESHQQEAWDLLQYLHDSDPAPWRSDIPTDPDHPLWSFCFAGSALFVNISSPAHQMRLSRNLGSALTLIIQPREGFDVVAPDTSKGRRTRAMIRQRLAEFDQVPPYPELGFYQDPRNREWKQYGIPDDDQPGPARCPLHVRKPQT